VNIHPTRSVPRNLVLRCSATVFSHPKTSSTRLLSAVAAMPGGAFVNGTTPAGSVLRYIRRHTQIAHGCHKPLGVIPAIRTQGDPLGYWFIRQHLRRRVPFRFSGCLRQAHIHHQPVAVLGNDVSQGSPILLPNPGSSCRVAPPDPFVIRVSDWIVSAVANLRRDYYRPPSAGCPCRPSECRPP